MAGPSYTSAGMFNVARNKRSAERSSTARKALPRAE